MAKAASSPHYFFRKDGILQRMDIEKLIYLETARNYVHFCSATEKLTLRTKLSNALAKLPSDRFIKVHRIFAVSLYDIDTVNKDHLLLKSISSPIPIGKPYYAEILKRINVLG